MQHTVDLGRIDPNCTATYHGTSSAYLWARCRCPHAREAERLIRKRRRENRHTSTLIDATGTARRLQALHAIGWTWTNLAARLDCTSEAVQQLATKRPTVLRRTADRVRVLYRDLSARPGPSQQARDRAAAKGWATPIAWHNVDDPTEQPQRDSGEQPPDNEVDEIAVGYAVQGKFAYGRLRPVDRVEAYRRLVAEGLGGGGIKGRLNINSDTYRKLVDLAAQADAGPVAA